MKRLRTDIDRQVMMRVEAARITFRLLTRALAELHTILESIKPAEEVEFDTALMVLEKAWSFVDAAHRFGAVVSQIRGFKHKDNRFQILQKVAPKIENLRNHIQHLNSQIPKSALDIYPITGALSWTTSDRKHCQTLSLGMLPRGTQFHSLSFDIEASSFIGGVTLYAEKHQLDIDQAAADISQCNEYLSEWLEKEGMLQDLDANPSFLTISAPNGVVPPSGAKYIRVRLEAGGSDF